MGMDPATAAIVWPLVISAVGGVAKGVSSPSSGQDLTSYEGSGELDPRNMLAGAKHAIEGAYGLAIGRATSPVDMSDAYVQDLPSFTGGALPMPIGVSGSWGANKPAAPVNPWTPNPNTDATASSLGGERADPNVDPTTGGPTNPTAFAGRTADPAASQDAPFNASDYGSKPLSLLTDGADSLPVRKSASLPDNGLDPMSGVGADMGGTGAGAGGGTDPRATGAVTLLLKLAQAGKSGTGAST